MSSRQKYDIIFGNLLSPTELERQKGEKMSKASNKGWISLNLWIAIAAVIGSGLITWLMGIMFSWSWSEFWSNFISNAASSAVIGFVLYWIITRPDEKKAGLERKIRH